MRANDLENRMVAGSHCGYDERSQVCPHCGREWVYQPRDRWHDEAYWFCELHQHVSDISPVKECCPLCEEAYNAEQERKEKQRLRMRKYYQEHREHILAVNRAYRKRNADMMSEYNKLYFKVRYKNDEEFREKRRAYNREYSRITKEAKA